VKPLDEDKELNPNGHILGRAMKRQPWHQGYGPYKLQDIKQSIYRDKKSNTRVKSSIGTGAWNMADWVSTPLAAAKPIHSTEGAWSESERLELLHELGENSWLLLGAEPLSNF
jgi:hypothetical protein